MTIAPPVVKTQMLIRRSASEVYRAFADPDVTSRFWFTRSSGPLEPGARVTWHWEMYGVSTTVQVKDLEPNRRIVIEWDDPPVPVEWQFEARPDETTLVSIRTWGFRGSDDEVVAKALDSQGGFSFVLAGLKAWLEHGVALNLVGDHFPPDVSG
jgi:uncharacterized protein YndB with AHSA1/START domain